MMHQLLGASPEIAAVRDQLARLLGHQAAPQRRLPPVLIQGETGTGKGLVSRLLHQMGPRAGAAFVEVNCAAIPDTLLEAELFGFERGAFTDARQAKPGLLHVAHRGTIFLDEIGLMPEALQAKLLKALEDRAIRRLGGTRAEPVDTWVIAATSEDLAAAIRARRFREDLYHRIAVVTLRLPPLRERGTDILLLARHYLGLVCAEYGVPLKTLTPDAERALVAYEWPGNVRELANVMERVALLSDREQVPATALNLPPPVPASRVPAQPDGRVDEQIAAMERSRIEEALHATGWNVSRAAARLGLPRNTLRYRMERHGLVDGGASRRRHVPDATRVPAASAEPSRRTEPVRWERARLTMLQATVHDADARQHERSGIVDELAAKASSFGGRLLELGVSSVKAVFGLDAVENAARRAAHAALAMQHSVHARPRPAAKPPQVRIVVHTEEMLVGRLGDRVEIDADARRAAEGVMDRLQAAGPGEPILVSGGTRPFLQRGFNVESVAPVTQAGVQLWRITGLANTERHPAPFVARSREMAVLDDLLGQVEEGRGQSVLLVGDAGIGKSRLLDEFRRRARGRATWLTGSALSFGSALPFHPLIDLLKDAFSIQAGDPEEIICSRIDEATAGFGDPFRPAVRFLRALLSVDPGDAALAQMDPKLRRAGTFDAVKQFLHAAAESRPLVVALEDAHWTDQATAEFLALMTDSVASARILLCVTHRSGYPLPFRDRLFGTQLTLSTISRADAGVVAGALLGASTVSPELQRLIDRKTEGNPFFVEEVVRSLRERGVIERRGDEVGLAREEADLDVPDTVQDVILGRLARLDPGSRDMLHVAAVIGREFARRVLERVLGDTPPSIDERVQALKSAEIVYSGRVWPEVVYVFRHALLHDVAYHAQPEPQREALHARIGDAIEQVYADRLSEQSGVLAHHFTRARRWDKALAYLLAAAQQAERTFATREALALYDEAQRAAERLEGGAGNPATLITIHAAKARLYFVTSDFDRSAAEGERILPLARLTGDRVKEGEALAAIAWASTWKRDLEAAIRFAREALAVAEPAGALAVQGRAHFTIGFVRGVTGVLDESDAALQKAITLSSAAGDPVHRSLALSTAGLLRNWEGNYGEAARLQAEGLTLARERGLLVPLLFGCFLGGMTLTGKGDYDAAFGTFTEGLALAERVGDEAIHHRLLNCLAWLHADLGDLDTAEALNTMSAQIGQRRRDPGTQPNAELNLGDIFRARGDLARAQDVYDAVFRYWKNPSTSQWMRFRYSIRMFASLGELALARNDLPTARRHCAECLELAARTSSRKNLVKAWRLSGEIARAERDPDRAEAHLRRSLDMAISLANPVQHWKSELALGRFLHGAGRPGEARDAFRRAHHVMALVRDGLRHERLRMAFESCPDVQLVQGLVADSV